MWRLTGSSKSYFRLVSDPHLDDVLAGRLPYNAGRWQENVDDAGEDAMRGRLALACVVMLIGVLLVGGVALAAGFRGTSGSDEISGTDRKDTIRGLGGDDRLAGRGGDDEIYGGGGKDKINGNNGDDRIMAADGKRDVIRCGSGRDYVYADYDRYDPDGTDLVYYRCEEITIVRPQ
jgi:Ca2+-binding RTX toxin-like protein